MQQIFLVYPDKDRFETNDLWLEHPQRKGLWTIVGRTDDYVYLAHVEGLHASTLEPEIERHELVKAALIGGHGQAKPILLIELVDSAQGDAEIAPQHRDLVNSLRPYLERVNARCHPSVHLSPGLVLFAKKDKQFERTAKGSVARHQTLQLYSKEIKNFYKNES